MVFVEPFEPGAVKLFAFLVGALRLLVQTHRPCAAQFHRPAHGAAPFLVQLADGVFKVRPEPLLVLLVTQLGFFRGGVQHAPRLRQIAGDGFRQRSRPADSPKISRPSRCERGQGNSRLRFGNDIHLEARKDKSRRADGQQQNRDEPDRDKSETRRQRKFFEARDILAGFFQQPLEFLEQFVFVRRKVGFRPVRFRG